MRMHDVIVIGGSLAGAACVRELERMGIDAIALERERFPGQRCVAGFSPRARSTVSSSLVLRMRFEKPELFRYPRRAFALHRLKSKFCLSGPAWVCRAAHWTRWWHAVLAWNK